MLDKLDPGELCWCRACWAVAADLTAVPGPEMLNRQIGSWLAAVSGQPGHCVLFCIVIPN